MLNKLLQYSQVSVAFIVSLKWPLRQGEGRLLDAPIMSVHEARTAAGVAFTAKTFRLRRI